MSIFSFSDIGDSVLQKCQANVALNSHLFKHGIFHSLSSTPFSFWVSEPVWAWGQLNVDVGGGGRWKVDMLSREQMRKNWGYIVTQGNFGREQGTPLPVGDRLFCPLSFKPHVIVQCFFSRQRCCYCPRTWLVKKWDASRYAYNFLRKCTAWSWKHRFDSLRAIAEVPGAIMPTKAPTIS